MKIGFHKISSVGSYLFQLENTLLLDHHMCVKQRQNMQNASTRLAYCGMEAFYAFWREFAIF